MMYCGVYHCTSIHVLLNREFTEKKINDFEIKNRVLLIAVELITKRSPVALASISCRECLETCQDRSIA